VGPPLFLMFDVPLPRGGGLFGVVVRKLHFLINRAFPGARNASPVQTPPPHAGFVFSFLLLPLPKYSRSPVSSQDVALLLRLKWRVRSIESWRSLIPTSSSQFPHLYFVLIFRTFPFIKAPPPNVPRWKICDVPFFQALTRPLVPRRIAIILHTHLPLPPSLSSNLLFHLLRLDFSFNLHFSLGYLSFFFFLFPFFFLERVVYPLREESLPENPINRGPRVPPRFFSRLLELSSSFAFFFSFLLSISLDGVL